MRSSFWGDSFVCLIPLAAMYHYGVDFGTFLFVAAVFLRLGQIQNLLPRDKP